MDLIQEIFGNEALMFGMLLQGIFVAVGVVLVMTIGKKLSSEDKLAFVWYTYDALTHLILEGSFIYVSFNGTAARNFDTKFASIWREYGKADYRWANFDSCVVSLEMLTVFIDGPLALLVMYAMLKNKSYRHFWQIVLCVAELYGGWMTFGPEWITGSPNLDISNPIYVWFYLFFFNFVWVVIPVILMVQSYKAVTGPKFKLQ